MVFNYYVKVSQYCRFSSRTYQLTQRDNMDQVIQKLRAGGTSAAAAGQLLVKKAQRLSKLRLPPINWLNPIKI